MKGKVPVISSEESVASPASIDTSQKPAGAQVFNAGSVKVELTGGACPGRVFGFPVDSRPRGPAEEGESERVVHSDPELEEAINSALPIALKANDLAKPGWIESSEIAATKVIVGHRPKALRVPALVIQGSR